MTESNDRAIPPSRRRDKPQQSCNFCRRRKQKCDRQRPCATCTTRGSMSSCSYSSNYGLGSAPGSRQPRTGIQERLGQLEELVISLMQTTTRSGESSHPTPDTSSLLGCEPVRGEFEIFPGQAMKDDLENRQTYNSSSPARSESGHMRLTTSGARYVGDAHWAAILDGIADLKEYFDTVEDTYTFSEESDVPEASRVQLLYGCKHASKLEILAAIPPRPAVDRFVSRYFNMLDLAPSAVHSTEFAKEYESFWKAPSEASVMWLGLLFSMMALAILASDTVDDKLLLENYRQKIVQCLLLAEYTESGPYTVETLFHYMTLEYSVRRDAAKDIWILLGMSVNVAMRSGYHRDSSHFPGISAFAGEMRRRAWTNLLQGDILIATQMGMPRLIKETQFDTREPSNLNDSDFNEDTKTLPVSRPETEMTTSLHLIARRRIFMALGAIVDLTTAARPYSYAEVMKVDQELYEAETNIPAPLRDNQSIASVTDTPQLVMHRLFISIMFHKGRITLHRKYLNIDQSGSRDAFRYSQDSCIDAALSILFIQHIFDEETCPGGKLYTMRWRVSSFMNHEFLTATMILCYVLHENFRPSSLKPLQRHEEIKMGLQKSRNIWIRASNSSTEARKAAQALAIILPKVHNLNVLGKDIATSVDLAATASMDLDETSFATNNAALTHRDYECNLPAASSWDFNDNLFPEDGPFQASNLSSFDAEQLQQAFPRDDMTGMDMSLAYSMFDEFLVSGQCLGVASQHQD